MQQYLLIQWAKQKSLAHYSRQVIDIGAIIKEQVIWLSAPFVPTHLLLLVCVLSVKEALC
jgi:hypothetical protein